MWIVDSVDCEIATAKVSSGNYYKINYYIDLQITQDPEALDSILTNMIIQVSRYSDTHGHN